MIRPLLIVLAIALPVFLMLDRYVDNFFVFKPANLQHLVQKNYAQHGNDTEALMRNLVTDLQIEYPGMVQDFGDRWIFNMAGGSCGGMLMLHASITEYLILFGSAAGTEGHSGAHMAHDYFTILSGRQTAGFLGELKPRVFLPGDQHHHPRGTTAHYKLDEGTWALELAQGWIPAMMPFGLVQMPMTLDWDSLFRTIYYTGKGVVLNLLKGKF